MTLSLGPSWDDTQLADALPQPEGLQPTITPAPPPPSGRPEDEEDDYLELAQWADLPLESADVDALIGEVKTRVLAADLLLPGGDGLIEQCVLTLLTGHLVVQGAPGTGKTTLARILADAFDCTCELQTATADWSTYDVIGGLQPKADENGKEVLRPWLGHVPRAALRCAQVIRDHHANPLTEPHQAHWLVIDEFSRAEIDKAIGGLYTVLGGSGERDLALWFSDDPRRAVVTLPKRFRIVATMNDVDASFVYDFSQGLSRRFQFVHVGVPTEEQLDTELAGARAQAARWLVGEYPDQAGTNDPVTLAENWLAEQRFRAATAVLREFVRRVRYPEAGAAGGGWPLGTAQLVDVLKPVALRIASDADLVEVLDSALADRVVPQMKGIAPVATGALIDWLREERAAELPRALLAASRLRETQATS